MHGDPKFERLRNALSTVAEKIGSSRRASAHRCLAEKREPAVEQLAGYVGNCSMHLHRRAFVAASHQRHRRPEPAEIIETLYEAIRTTDMCVVDWSELRANVMYELGVRLAVNPLGAVHICASHQAKEDFVPEHVSLLKERFQPITYRSEPGDYQHFDAMIERFEESRRQGRQFPDCLVYEKIGAVLERPDLRVAPDVVHDLVQEANLLSSDDESTGVSPVLYHDVNRLIRSEASDAATERRIAA